MKPVATLHEALSPEQLRDPATVQHRIAQAYASLMTGNGTEVDAGIVLVDLAFTTRYYDTTNMTTPAEQVKAFDARRTVFQRVLEGMTKLGEEPRGLHTAVLVSVPLYAEHEEIQE